MEIYTDDEQYPALRRLGYSKDDPQWWIDLLKMEYTIDYEEYQKEEAIKLRNTWKRPGCFHEKYLCTGKLKFLVEDSDGYKEFYVLNKDEPNKYVIEDYIYSPYYRNYDVC